MSALARFTSLSPRPAAGSLRHLARDRGLRLMLRSGAMVLAAAGLAAGSLALAAGLTDARGPSAQAQAAARPAEWTDIVHPMALYDLAGTEFSKLPSTYRARRHRGEGAREDVLTFGALGLAKPYLQLSLLRLGPDPDAQPDDGFADGLARLASARGLTATQIRAAAPVGTRLGRIEAADMLLWEGGAATPCLGFRGATTGGSVLRLSGFACGVPGRPVGRAALACAIDRVDLLAAGDDAALRAVFVAAERRGGSSCIGAAASTSAGSLLPTGRHLGWLDPDGDMPPLRGLFEATARQR